MKNLIGQANLHNWRRSRDETLLHSSLLRCDLINDVRDNYERRGGHFYKGHEYATWSTRKPGHAVFARLKTPANRPWLITDT